ncbi:hypothetical protein HPP92_013701 [Vanilla planifolia]|uniref:NPH3 domain-containing protein n=1 Tax=Vanilla planifolia TaxID=51239 RepID=A0A835R2G4_VANPL|nr:hypothetical protein HPP92_013701 [Vanilla planifolia]
MWEDNSSHRQERKNSSLASASGRSKAAVSKLVVDFLGEAAKDPELPLSKFAELAEMVSGWVAASHDGLYHAIDMFLKGHPFLTKNEKKKVCNLMDCSKLSADASLHAVQNDCLPLRTVVRVLFFEQFRRSSAGRVESGLPSGVVDSFIHQDGGAASRGSSKSAATSNTTEDEWDGPPAPDVGSLKNLSEGSSGSGDTNKDDDNKGSEKAKGVLKAKSMMSKLWSGKTGVGENSGSDTSEGNGSINLHEMKTNHSRNTKNPAFHCRDLD